MKTRVLISCMLISCFMLVASAAKADVSLDPIWPSAWDATVDKVIGVGNFDNVTYVAPVNETGIITDFDVVGDYFSVYVNGVDVLDTPVVPDWSTYCGDAFGACSGYTTDPNVALANPMFSSGTFALNAGDEVTIKIVNIPTGFSDSTYAITATTPEPGTLSLLGLGLAGLISRKRRVKK